MRGSKFTQFQGVNPSPSGCAADLSLWERGSRCASGQRLTLSASTAAHIRRSTISFFNSAMALAGLNPFGQALAQFIIVWQR